MSTHSTIVSLFQSREQAMQAKQALIAAGFRDADISITGGDLSTAVAQRSAQEDKGFWESLKELFTGEDEEYSGYYAEGVRRGGTLTTVRVETSRVDEAVAILRKHNAVDIDKQAAAWKASGWKGYDASATRYDATQAKAEWQNVAVDQNVAIPVVEEQIAIGKRAVQRGGVRILQRVVERPVSEQVTLREEHVRVERRPVNRELAPGEVDAAFREKRIEATETAEVAVVAKEAKVVEEITLKKDVRERTETVRDTVRKTEVDVQQTPGSEKTVTEKTTATQRPTAPRQP